MINKIRYYWKALTDSYFIQISYVEKSKIAPLGAMELIEKKYIIYDKEKGIEYTDYARLATCFGFVLGALIVKKLQAVSTETPNLQFELVSTAGALFVEDVTGGPKSSITGDENSLTRELAIDRLNKSLEELKEIINIEGVHGFGSILNIDENKNKIDTIEVAVIDEQTKQKALNFIKNTYSKNATEPVYIPNTYKGYPIKIVITEQPKILV